MLVPELQQELEYFETHRQELLERAAGKIALIKGGDLVNIFDSEENAYEEGVRLFGNDAFLIQEILPEDIVKEMPAYASGILHAGL